MRFILGVLCEHVQRLRHYHHEHINEYDVDIDYSHCTPLCRQAQQVVVVQVSDHLVTGIVRERA